MKSLTRVGKRWLRRGYILLEQPNLREQTVSVLLTFEVALAVTVPRRLHPAYAPFPDLTFLYYCLAGTVY
jgi:hypothetical protein